MTRSRYCWLMLIVAIVVSGCATVTERELRVLLEEEAAGREMPQQPSAGGDAMAETVSDYLAHAALNNAGLEARFNEWVAAVERISQAGVLPDPRFTYVYFVEEVETRVGPQRQRFELSQMFPWFGTLRAKESAATARARAAYHAYGMHRDALFAEVRQTCAEYAYLGKAIEITRENLRVVLDLERIARARLKTASGGHDAVVRAQVELGKLEDRLRSLEDQRGPLMARLNALLNRAADSPVPWLKLEDLEASGADTAAVLNAFGTHSPLLLRERARIAAAESGVAIAARSGWPDMTIGVGITDTGEAATSTVEDSGKNSVTAMVGFSIPLWRGKVAASRREAKALYEAAKAGLDDRESMLEAELRMSVYHYHDAERKLALYRDGLIPKAREALAVSREGYEAGNTGFSDVIDSERMLLDFELTSARAIADRFRHAADIERLSGVRFLQTQSEGGKSEAIQLQ